MAITKQKKQRKLKFSILPKLKFYDVIKNKQTLMTLEENELAKYEGTAWRDWAYIVYELLNEKYPGQYSPGLYSYVFQVLNTDQLEVGQMKLLSREPGKQQTTIEANQMDYSKDITDLKNKIANMSAGNMQIDLLLSITKQGYETQINFLNSQINYKDNSIKQLETKLKELQDEADDLNQQLAETTGAGSSNVMQMIEMAQKFLSLKVTNPNINLKESQPNGIPEEIINIFGLVDYEKISDAEYGKLVTGLKQYIQLLPLRGQ